MMTKKYRSIDQNKLKILCDHICDNIYDLLDHFELEYKNNTKFISLHCPIHGGDNATALNIYPEGDTYRGNWKCRTHKCEEVFKGSIIGFIRGILSRNHYGWTNAGDTTASFQEAVDFATDFAKLDLQKIKIDKGQKNKHNFVSSVSILNQNTQTTVIDEKPKITRSSVTKLLNIPSQYFLDRGFSRDILHKYDVGDCMTPGKEMYNRAVVPVYDNTHSFLLGCSGRTTNNESPKWKHSFGFRAEDCLYNFWYAKQHIKNSREVILVESPGNVWKLEMADIHNSVAMFGSNLTDKQKLLLDTSGAMALIVITDNDDAGELARQQIEKKCAKIYNIKHIRVSTNDIADMSVEEIHNEITTKIRQYK